MAGSTSYNVEMNAASGWQWASGTGFDQTSLAVTGLSPDKTYSFWVAAWDASGEAFSATQTATTFPAAPQFAAGVPSPSQLNVCWGPVAGATSYEVSVLPLTPGSGSTQTLSVSPTRGATLVGSSIVGLTAGTTYAVQVASINPLVGTSWSSPSDVTLAPSTPTLQAQALSSTEVRLSWNDVVGATLYGVWTPPDQNDVSNTTTSYTVTGLTPGGKDHFTVGCVQHLRMVRRELRAGDHAARGAGGRRDARLGLGDRPVLDPDRRRQHYEVDLTVNGDWQK